MQPFDPNEYYRPTDPAVAKFWSANTLANRRVRGDGPAYIKLGGASCTRAPT